MRKKKRKIYHLLYFLVFFSDPFSICFHLAAVIIFPLYYHTERVVLWTRLGLSVSLVGNEDNLYVNLYWLYFLFCAILHSILYYFCFPKSVKKTLSNIGETCYVIPVFLWYLTGMQGIVLFKSEQVIYFNLNFANMKYYSFSLWQHLFWKGISGEVASRLKQKTVCAVGQFFDNVVNYCPLKFVFYT